MIGARKAAARALLSALVAAAVAACGSDKANNGNPDGGGNPDAGPTTVEFSAYATDLIVNQTKDDAAPDDPEDNDLTDAEDPAAFPDNFFT